METMYALGMAAGPVIGGFFYEASKSVALKLYHVVEIILNCALNVFRWEEKALLSLSLSL
jgi:hypothetical protein